MPPSPPVSCRSGMRRRPRRPTRGQPEFGCRNRCSADQSRAWAGNADLFYLGGCSCWPSSPGGFSVSSGGVMAAFVAPASPRTAVFDGMDRASRALDRDLPAAHAVRVRAWRRGARGLDRAGAAAAGALSAANCRRACSASASPASTRWQRSSLRQGGAGAPTVVVTIGGLVLAGVAAAFLLVRRRS